MKKKILLLVVIILGVVMALMSMISRDEDYDIIIGRVLEEGDSLGLIDSEILTSMRDNFSADIEYIESKNIRPSLEELSNRIRVDMVWLEGEEQLAMAEELAQKNGSMDYIIMGGTLGASTPKNALGVLFRMEQVSFLSGVLASSISQGDTVGFIGSAGDEDGEIFEYGYRAGVSYLNAESGQETEVQVDYISSSKESQAQAMEKMIAEDIDIIFMAIEDISKEALELAESKEITLIVRESENTDLESTSIGVRLKKNNDRVIYEIVGEFYEGNFSGGSTNLYGLEEEAIDILYGESSRVRVSDIERVEIIKNLIRSEKMDIPVDEETFNRYTESMLY